MVLIERGITFRLNLIYNKKTLVICPVLSENYRKGLGFEDLSVAYFCVFIGFFLCILAFLFEKTDCMLKCFPSKVKVTHFE